MGEYYRRPLRIGNFVCRNTGLYLVNTNGRRRISDYIRVSGLSKAEGSEDYHLIIEFKNLAGELSEISVARSQLRQPQALLRILCDRGFRFFNEKDNNSKLIKYLKLSNHRSHRITAPRTGWFDNAFVFSDEIIGPGSENLRYQPGLQRRPEIAAVNGSLDAWTNQVAGNAYFSTRLMFGISVAFAAMLLKSTKVESGGFHFFDSSSRGKTSLQLFSQSVGQWPGREDMLKWDITDTALEELAMEHCDQLLVLDEISLLSADPKIAADRARQASFKLTGGTGRIRSHSYGSAGNLARWRVLMLSSGESSLFAIAKAAHRTRLAGDQVRMIDVPAGVHPKFGVFEFLPQGHKDARKLLKTLERATTENYGVAAREFVRRLCDDLDDSIMKVNKWRQRFDRIAHVPSNGWERRFSSRFGLAYAAARLARHYGIVKWSPRWIKHAIQSCYRAARSIIPNFQKELDGAIAHIQQQLLKGTGMRDLRQNARNDRAPKARKARFFIKYDRRYGTIYVVRPRTLRKWVGDKINLDSVAEQLDRRRCLVKQVGFKRTRQILIPGIRSRRRYYCITERFVRQSTDRVVRLPDIED